MTGDQTAMRLMAKAQAAGLDSDEDFQRRIRIAALTGNQGLIHALERVMASRAVELLVAQHSYHVPHETGEVAAPILFGREAYSGYPAGFDLSEGHILVIGATRTGKTTFVLRVLPQIMQQVPFWAFDPKQDLRHVIRDLPSVYPLRIDRGLKFNPLQPFGTMFLPQWRQRMFDIFCQGEDLLSGSKAYGLGLIELLFDRTQGRPPTMFEFLDLVKNELAKARPGSVRSRYAERLFTRLHTLLNVFGQVYDCAIGFPVEELAQENVVFETDGVETIALQFQILTLLFSNYHWRLETGQRGDQARQVFIVDEAQTVFSPLGERNPASGIPFIDLMVQRSAEFGIIFLVCNQNSRLAYAIRENSRTTICFGLVDGHDRASMARTLSLDLRQEEGLGGLGVGEAVVQIAGRCPRPMKVLVDDCPLVKNVSGREVASHVRPFLSRMFQFVVPVRQRHPEPQQDEQKKASDPSFEEEALLRHVHLFPGVDWTTRTKQVKDQHGMSQNAARKSRDRLVRRGLLETVRVSKGSSRGASFLGLVITQKGRQFLRDRNVHVGNIGRGQAEHRFWVSVARAYYESQGFECEVEASLSSEVCVDLLVYGPDGKRLAVEVETTPDTAVRNVGKLVAMGMDRIRVAADGEDLLETIRGRVTKALAEESLAGVKFLTVQTYLDSDD